MEVKKIYMIGIVILISICVFVNGNEAGNVTESMDGTIDVTAILSLSTEKDIRNFTDPEETTEKDIHQAECSCGIYGKSCKYVNGKKNCTCMAAYADRLGECTLCGCTGNSSGCRFDAGGEMVCNCSKGFAQQRNECKKCDCGENGHCGFLYDTLKYCKCKKGYELYGESCRECDCGENGRCFIYGMVKNCVCNEGYQQYEGLCKACVCSDNKDCTFDSNGNKVCGCPTGYGIKNGMCTPCECGKDYNCTFTVFGLKRCQCPKGYAELIGTCEDIDGCLDSRSCPDSTNCVNTPGSYDCVCKAGYEPLPGRVHNLKKDGCRDIDECETRFVCTPFMRCINTPGSYKCECETGYRLSSSSTYCESVSELRPWSIASIVFGCVLGVIMTGLLIVLRRKCRT